MNASQFSTHKIFFRHLCWFVSADLLLSYLTFSTPSAVAQPAENIAQTRPPATNPSNSILPNSIPSNSIEQTLPTPPTPLPIDPPTPPPSPELETAPQPPPTETIPSNLPRFPLEKVEILGSPDLHPVLKLDVLEQADQQQVKETINTLISQSSCDLITPSLQALSGLSTQTQMLSISLQPCEATFEDLVRLRTAITLLYTSNGYITSGAFLPTNQELDRRTVTLQVVEGLLERIDICMLPNNSRETGFELEEVEPEAIASPNATLNPSSRCNAARLQQGYVRSRLNLASTVPLSQPRLERALQLLQLDPLIEQVNAELTAGSSPGQNALLVRVREASPLSIELLADNAQSPSIGSNQASLTASYANIIRIGDRLSTQYGITEGLNLYDISYSIPLNPREGTLTLRYSNNNSNIITDEFEDLGIRSEAETFSVGFRQPLERTPTTEFALGLGVDVRHSQTFILEDRPFSFSEGAENGRARVTALRFSQDWVRRGRQQVLAARTQFSLGIDAFDATVNRSGTDGLFFSWLGQFQYVQQIPTARILLVTRLNAQLTPDSLLSLERFSFGGVDSVRGYAQNQVVADNGAFSSVELRIPLTDNPNRLQIVPFVEAGYAWNNKTADPPEDFIAGVGLGLRWQPIEDLDIRLDYGIPLIDVVGEGDSLQENGIYFSLRYHPF